jgi:hypothetical protein
LLHEVLNPIIRYVEILDAVKEEGVGNGLVEALLLECVDAIEEGLLEISALLVLLAQKYLGMLPEHGPDESAECGDGGLEVFDEDAVAAKEHDEAGQVEFSADLGAGNQHGEHLEDIGEVLLNLSLNHLLGHRCKLVLHYYP